MFNTSGRHQAGDCYCSLPYYLSLAVQKLPIVLVKSVSRSFGPICQSPNVRNTEFLHLLLVNKNASLLPEMQQQTCVILLPTEEKRWELNLFALVSCCLDLILTFCLNTILAVCAEKTAVQFFYASWRKNINPWNNAWLH